MVVSWFVVERFAPLLRTPRHWVSQCRFQSPGADEIL
jgi:hypothetical protein